MYGQKITSLRKASSMTQAELGDKLNVSAQAVSKWELDQSQPDLDTVKKICELFNISVGEFFGMEDNVTEETESTMDPDETPEEVETPTENTETREVYGYCANCNKTIYQGDKYLSDYKNVNGEYQKRTLCEKCYYKLHSQANGDTKDSVLGKKGAKNSIAKTNKSKGPKAKGKGLLPFGKVRFFISLGVAIISAVIVGLISFRQVGQPNEIASAILSDNSTIKKRDAIITTLMTFTLVSQLFWDGSVCDVMSFFCRSIKMPGVIFELSWDGLKSLIIAKIILAILSGVLSIALFVVGIFVAGFYSIVIFIPALIKTLINGINLY